MRRQHKQKRHEVGELPYHGKADQKVTMVRDEDIPVPGARRVAPFKALTDTQGHYAAGIRSSILTIGAGPAGTGKSFCSVAIACDMLKDKLIEKIIITRPAVEADEDLGFLPGDISEKFAPYFAPVLDILHKRLGEGFTTYCIRKGKIVAMPLAFMRGHSFENTFVLLDEAQNTTPKQMKMFLTRMGEGTKCVVEGDVDQTDIDGPNGLEDALYRFGNHPSVSVTRFERSDIVRSGFVQDVVEAYEKPARPRRNLDLDTPDGQQLPASITGLVAAV